MKTCLVGFLLTVTAIWAQGQSIDDISDVHGQLDSLSQTIRGLNERVDFTLVNAPLHDLLRAVAETHNLNVSFRSIPSVNVTNNFTDVKVKDLLTFVCQEYNLSIRFVNNIFSFYEQNKQVVRDSLIHYDRETGQLDIDVRNDPLLEVARLITQQTPYNLVVDQTAQNHRVFGFVKDLPVRDAIQNLMEANGLELVVRDSTVLLVRQAAAVETGNNNNGRRTRRPVVNGTFDFRPVQSDGQKMVSLSAQLADIKSLIEQISNTLEIDYFFVSDPSGQLTCRLDSVLYEDFLTIALEASELTFTKTEQGIYVLGDAQKGGLNESRVFSFKRRSVEGVEEIIPEALMTDVTVAPFNDLNALIITGSDKRTEKLLEFLEQIDRPVPNILIEVIVADIRKGASIQTGVKGFIGDSVPSSGGQIFSGIDLTLSSQSLNRFLNNLDSRGVLNLGRVTPNFYVTLQAMEANNNLNIRSTPKLSTINGHEATLTIGESVYYLIETQNVTGGVNPIVTVTPRYEKVEANLELIISPFVSDYQDITLEVEAEFSDFIAPEIEGAPPGNSTRKFISKIRLKDGETIVVGGLEESSRSETGSGVPFLSRIPVIKWFFSSKTKDRSESKLLIFIKPTIVY